MTRIERSRHGAGFARYVAACAIATGLGAGPADADPDLAAVFATMTPSLAPGDWTIHDPSRILTIPGGQMIVATGRAQEDGYRCGLETWTRLGPGEPWRPDACLFTTKPGWIAEELPDNDGAFWAPDLVDADTLVYSVSAGFDAPGSCLGLARREGDSWIDSGAPLSCHFPEPDAVEISVIDPSVFVDADGRPLLVTGGGVIHATRLDPGTLMPRSGDWYESGHPDWTDLARGPARGAAHRWVEAAYIHPRDGAYFLFVNWGACCRGAASTYRIMVGRSDAPLGPYAAADGVPMLEGGGTLVLEGDGAMRGPGHTGIWTDANGNDWISFHFYDAGREGLSWIGEARLDWSGGWPVATDLRLGRPE